MKCPSCGYKNLPGSDECEACQGDLTSFSGVVPKSRIEKVLMSDKLSKVGPRKPVIVNRTTSVLEAIHKMNEQKTGNALVMAEENLEGILTERDILLKVLGKETDLSKLTVEKVMTPNPTTLLEENTLAVALNRMSVGGYRHLPILKNGKPVGIISVRDVLKYLAKLFPKAD